MRPLHVVFAAALVLVVAAGCTFSTFAAEPGPEPSAHPTSGDLPPGVSQDWWSTVQASIAAEEYFVSWQAETPFPDIESGHQAPNRAHGFRTWFTGRGVRLVPRTETTASWEWRVELFAWGRPGAMRPTAPARLSVTGNRVEADRGELVEWFVNDSNGLEQGFTIDARPDGDGPLALDLVLGGTLSAILAEDGKALDLVADGGRRVLHYGQLATRDAGGTSLPSRFESFCDDARCGIRIVIDDAGAAYPLTIDPLVSSPSWSVVDSDESSDLGRHVVPASDVNGDGFDDVVVSDPEFDAGTHTFGIIRLYLGSPSGLTTLAHWSYSALGDYWYLLGIAPAGDFNGDGYGDFAAKWYYLDGNWWTRVTVYCGNAEGIPGCCGVVDGQWEWSSLGNFATAGDVNGDGLSDLLVNLTGDRTVALYLGDNYGCTYIHSMWEVECPLGCTVGTAGDVDGNGYADFAIGEPTRETVRVYYGSASGPQGGFWMETGVEGSWFGSAVLAAGDLNGDGFGDLAVGSPDEDGSAGRVRVYRGSMSGPSHDAPWVFGAGGQAGQQFGTAVGTAGDVNGDGYADLLITAPFYDTAGEADAGRAHVYYGSASGPASTPAWTVEGVGSSRYYGRAATTAGDVNGDGFSDVIVGAPGSESVPGAVYAYHGGPAGLGPNSGWTKEGGLAGAYFGYSVAPAGDVNGDGYGDVIIGAVYYDDGQTREGKAFVFNGSATGLPFLPNWTATSDQAEARMGYSVSSAGDVNGDGYDDVLVGCRGYSNPESDEGAAFVWYGSDRGLGPFGTPANADWSAEANQVDAYFGISVSTAGDINGDGYGDIIVGASLYDDGQTDEGAAFVWHGHPAGLGKGGTPSNADWAATGNQVSSRFGAAVASAGDVNGDGFGDVLVGAYLYDAPEANEGMAFAWYGSPAGLGADGTPTNADWSAESDQAGASFGFALASAGDVNGDARSDVVVGAYLYDLPSLADCGRVTVFHGLPSGIAGSPAFTAYGGGVDDRAGQSVRSAGDVNGDGYADIVYGAPNWDGVGKLKCGRAFVDYGGAGGISTGGSWVAEGAAADDGFGTSVAGVGDIDGDGYADVLIGAPYRDNPESAEGAVGLFYGNEGRSRLSKPGQYDGGPDAGIIPRYGRSNDDYYVRLTGRAYGLIGPAAFSTESEVKSAGVPFDGTGIRRGSATFLTSLAGTDFTDLRLVKSGLQHWRVRARYTASTSPFQSHGRWYHPVWDGWNAGSFRTRQDPDGDNVPTERDNCPADANPAQEDADGDGRGDACDVCTDTDGDGYGDPGYPVNTCEQDNCPALPNPEQADADRDDTGDACDACIDTDRDGFGDPGFPGDSCPDDNCWGHANPGQEDGDADGIGNVCDNCPTNANPNQEDFDHDGAGDLCDLCTDTDGDGYGNPGFPRSICPGDNCPDVPSADRTDTDRDGSGDVCDDCTDQDLDGFGMPPAQLQTCQLDNCYRAYNPGQEDADTDGSGDVCDKCTDTDSDGWGTPGFPVNTCAEDCRPDDNTIWSAPTPIDSLMLTRAPTGNLTWSPPSNPGATTIQYDAMSSRKSDDWSIFEAMCILSDTTALTATEPSLPPPGQAYYYLVRAEGPCGSTMGTRSDGTPRIGRACP